MSTAQASDAALAAMKAAQAAVNAAASAPATFTVEQPWAPDLVRFLATSVLLFTFGALLLGSALLWRHRTASTQILRLFGVVSIIGISALLLVVGYSNEQLTPIVGLFGAIAGYLLGKEPSKESSSASKEA